MDCYNAFFTVIFQGLIHEGHVQLLHAAGISSFTLLITHMRENDGVDGLASATLNIIVEEAYRIRVRRTQLVLSFFFLIN